MKQTKGRKKQSVPKKQSINKKDQKAVIYLDPEKLQYPERVKREESKILEETAKTENKSKLKDLSQFEEDIAISAANFDVILHDKFITEKENEKRFSDLMIGKRVGLKITDSELQSKRGAGGGKKPKKNKPILLAVTQYLREHRNLKDSSSKRISISFKRDVNKNKPITINFDECAWDVNYYENDDSEYIEAIPSEEYGKKRHKEKLIKISTFIKSYIPDAKLLIIKN